MRIAMITAGSRGDLQPYVALGAGLRSAGHDVWLVSYAHYEDFVTRQGLGFRPITNVFEELSRTELWRRWQSSGERPLCFARLFRRIVRGQPSCFVRLFDDAWNASQGAEALVYPTAGLGGPDIAEKLGVPGYWAHLYPTGVTAEFPFFLSPTWLRPGAAYNRLTYRLASRGYRRLFGRLIDDWRRNTLALPPRPRTGAFDPFGAGRAPVLNGFSPALVTKPRDWGDHQHVTGYWFLDSGSVFEPPQALTDFLRSGPPPIFASASSLEDHPELLWELAAHGPRRARCRFLLQVERDDLDRGVLSENAFTVGDIPYGWLFRHVRGVVHHGGPGTAAEALRAGVPSLAVPGFLDQPFWARRLYELGVGPRPIPRRRLTLERLLASVARLACDERLQARAAELAARVRREPGVAGAVAILDRDLAARGRARPCRS